MHYCMNKAADFKLLIDNSNTRTKLMYSCGGELLSEQIIIPTCELNASKLRRVVSAHNFSQVVVSSVVPSAAAAISEAFGNLVRFIKPSDVLSVDFEYDGISTLGADRIANIAGCVLYGRFPCVAVDLGTAITFDVLTERGGRPVFVGGSIAPGLSTMSQSLSQKTALLPSISFAGIPRALAQNTVGAMQSGCLFGCAGLVRELLRVISDELGCRPFVLATGGDASLIFNMNVGIDAVDSLLTFKGLNEVARLLL